MIDEMDKNDYPTLEKFKVQIEKVITRVKADLKA